MKKGLVIGAAACLALTLAIGIAEAATVSQKTKGKILLQVESKGEAWYVNPATGERNSLGKPSDALSVMKKVGVGITNADLQKIQLADKNLASDTDTDGDGLSDTIETALGTDKTLTDSDADGTDDKTEALSGYDPNSSSSTSLLDAAFAKKQAGKILLQVESKGEAWYVNPDDNKRYFLGRPADAFNVMRSLGLGISNNDLDNIKVSGQSSSTASSSKTTVDKKKTSVQDDKTNKATSTPPIDMGGRATSTPPMKGNATSTPPISRGDRATSTPPTMGNGEKKDNGLFGTVATLGDSSLTITTFARGGNNIPSADTSSSSSSESSSETYSVTLSDSTVYSQDRATSTISAIAVGSKVMVFGTVDTANKTVAATKIDITTKEPTAGN